MAGLEEYVKHYGKITMQESPFNEVDNLALAEIAYTPIDEIWAGHKKMKISEIAPLLHFENQDYWDTQALIYRDAARILSLMGNAPRFQDMEIIDYVNHIDTKTDVQFSAMTIRMNRKQIYVAFRGTDDTLVGWKEDFQMSYKTPIPSQEEAVDYLNHAISPLFFGQVYVGGHSKGGNLAVFSSLYCKESIRKKIVSVFNNDGPGFLSKMMERPEYQAMLPRIHTFVPRTSMIGMLFDHEEEYTVVQSDQVGFMQHCACSWQILGNQFVTLKKTDVSSAFINRTVKNWLETADDDTREKFTEAVYGLLIGGGFESAHELMGINLMTIRNTVKGMTGLSEEQRVIIIKMLVALFIEGGRTMTKILQFY